MRAHPPSSESQWHEGLGLHSQEIVSLVGAWRFS